MHSMVYTYEQGLSKKNFGFTFVNDLILAKNEKSQNSPKTFFKLGKIFIYFSK